MEKTKEKDKEKDGKIVKAICNDKNCHAKAGEKCNDT